MYFEAKGILDSTNVNSFIESDLHSDNEKDDIKI